MKKEEFEEIKRGLDRIEEKLDRILFLLNPNSYTSPRTDDAQWDPASITITYPYTLEETTDVHQPDS